MYGYPCAKAVGGEGKKTNHGIGNNTKKVDLRMYVYYFKNVFTKGKPVVNEW